jgi:hypothetical protein
VVYISDKSAGCMILYPNGQVHLLDKDAFKDTLTVLFDPNTVLIYDGDGEGKGKPPIVDATTVVITSPQPTRYKAFSKTGALELYFPVFSRDEIEDMLACCYPALCETEQARDAVWARYDRWGGIPRYVLELLEPHQQAKLEAAITAVSLDKLAEVMGAAAVEDTPIVSHRLVHLKPTGETTTTFTGGDTIEAYGLARTEYASDYAAELVHEAIETYAGDELEAFLAQPNLHPALAKV